MLNNEEDRISNLPDAIIHHILYFFHNTKQAVQASVLSRRWRYVWTNLLFLNFCEYRGGRERSKREHDFEVLVNKVLLLRESCSNIHGFSLRCLWHDFDVYNYAWILKVVRHNVQELFLELDDYSRTEFRCELPYCLFTCKSLTTFELKSDSGWHLKLNLPDSMSLPSLKTLVFYLVQFDGDDILYKICSSCPLLESLSLINCKLDQTYRNIFTPKLKHLEIFNTWRDDFDFISDWSGCSFKLYAPNLISFHIDDSITTDYSIENLSALVKAEIDMGIEDELDEEGAKRVMKFLKTLHNVEDLKLSNNFLEVVSGSRLVLEGQLIQFCKLRCLKLRTGLSRNSINAITYLLKISPNIESLFLDLYKTSLEMEPYWDEVRDNSAESGEFYLGAGMVSERVLHHLKLVKI